jgi:hypothetical protein
MASAMKRRKPNITSGLRKSNGDWIARNRYGKKIRLTRCGGEWCIESIKTEGVRAESARRGFPTLRSAIEYAQAFKPWAFLREEW